MFVKIKKLVALLLAVLMTVSLFAGCGDNNTDVSGEGGSKTAIVKFNRGGYGDEWLYAMKEAFEEAYKEEGYKIEIQIVIGDHGDLTEQEIKLGPEKTKVDLFITSNVNIYNLLAHSRKVMNDDTTPLLEPLDDVFYSPAIGADKQEEAKTIEERVFSGFRESYIYDGDDIWNGTVFTLGAFTASTGIAVNPAVFERYGVALPNTTDELIAAVKTISEKGAADGVYPFVWAGNNAPGYWSYLYDCLFAQYAGVEAFRNFVATQPESGDIINDGWKVYEDKAILESLKVLEPMMNLDYAPNGSINFTHTEAQHYLMVGEAGFMITGDWLLSEMKKDYYAEASNCIMLKTPVLSVIGTECGITDAQLSQAVTMVDEGKTNEEIVAAISGLTEEGAIRIRNARNIYSSIGASLHMMMPNYADAKDVAKLFIKFMYSEDGCRIMRDNAHALVPVACESYETTEQTTFLDSIAKVMNDGEATAIFYDPNKSIIRSSSGLLEFNYSAFVSPNTFKSMMLDKKITAQYIYEKDLEYVKNNWANYIAYVGLG